MKAILALCLIIAASINAVSSSYVFPGWVVVDDAVTYALDDFLLNTTFAYMNISSDPTSGLYNASIEVSLAPTVQGCNYTNDKSNLVYGRLNTSSTGKCYEIAVSKPSESNFTSYNADDITSGVDLYFPYSNSTVGGYQLAFEFICNSSVEHKSQFDSFRSDFNSKLIIASVQSGNSCPDKTLSQLVFFYNQHPVFFAVVFVIIGAFIAFFGLPMLKYTIFIVGTVAGTLLSAVIIFNFLSVTSHGSTFWIVFVICFLIGCVVGFVAVKIETVGFIVLGAVLGVTGGKMLHSALIAPMNSSAALYWVVLIVCGLIGAGIAYKFWKNFVIIATAILGALFISYNIGSASGTLPSQDELETGVKSFNAAVYGYIALSIVIAVAGIYFQHKKKREMDLEKETGEDVHGYQRVMAYNP